MKISLSLIVAFVLCFATRVQAGFEDELKAMLNVSKAGYATIEGKYLEQMNNGSKVYESKLPLSGFVPKVVVDPQGHAMVIASAYGSEAELNANMMVMLPPDGYAFEKHDSNEEKNMSKPGNSTRVVAYISKSKNVMFVIYYQPDNYYTITVSRFTE